jgi:deoxyribodipyrimidine photo-lyase
MHTVLVYCNNAISDRSQHNNKFYNNMNTRKLIYLIRDDLRISDNPALSAAAREGHLMLVFIHDPYKIKPRGAAFNWWTYKSLQILETNFREKYNCQIHYYVGNTVDILQKLVAENAIDAIYCNQAFDTDAINTEKTLGKLCKTFAPNLLHHPADILNESGLFYKVFTAYWRKAITLHVEPPICSPRYINSINPKTPAMDLNQINLLPQNNWYQKFDEYWKPGEDEAQKLLDDFIAKNLYQYQLHRDCPSDNATSKLSPYLAHGEISVRDIWQKISLLNILDQDTNITSYCTELGWREFSYNILYHMPSMSDTPLKSNFSKFDWRQHREHLEKWQKGCTGYPIVDAGMRQLWSSGWMHNRVRMIVGSFLTKDLLIKWQEGEKWFWDCLVDADYASNPASWQWVAGCGYDAAPYFRIFNPITQAKRFDPYASYISKWVQELRDIDYQLIHQEQYGSRYMPYIVNHKEARCEALMRYKEIV